MHPSRRVCFHRHAPSTKVESLVHNEPSPSRNDNSSLCSDIHERLKRRSVCNSGDTGKGVCAEDNGPFRLDSVCACATPSIAKISSNNNIWSLATLSRHDSATVFTVHGSADPVHDLDFNIATHAIPPLLQKRLSSSPGKVTPLDEAMLETIAATSRFLLF